MVQFARATAFFLLVAAASALAPPQPSRRQLLQNLVGAGLAGVVATVALPQEASAVKSKTGLGSVFTGDYDDPNHPGCLRQVKVVGAPLRGDGTRSAYPVVEVKGWDGKEGDKMCADRPDRSQLWSINGKLKSKEEASFDFSPKGGPANLTGKWDGESIVFPDGNKWTKVLTGTPDRRPADMSTLKSSS
jgi:hypothetical protein